MDEKSVAVERFRTRSAGILYEDWDPLGLRGVAPSDEYDSYLGGVYRLLASGASCEQVAEHLAEVERGPLGYSEATAARNMTAQGSCANSTSASERHGITRQCRRIPSRRFSTGTTYEPSSPANLPSTVCRPRTCREPRTRKEPCHDPVGRFDSIKQRFRRTPSNLSQIPVPVPKNTSTTAQRRAASAPALGAIPLRRHR